MNITRRSGFCRMKAWRSSWMRGTTMWLPFTRRTVAGSLILSASSSTCLTQGPAAFTIAFACTVRLPRSPFKLAAHFPPERRAPPPPPAPRRHERGVGEDGRAVRGRRARVEHHQARVVHPAVVVDEAALEFGLEAGPVAVAGEADALRIRQRAPASEAEHVVAEGIVGEEP